MPKFFIDKNTISENRVSISGSDCSHLVKVLRIKEGDNLTLCDGEGTDFDAVVSDVSKEQVDLEILNSYLCSAEPEISVVLFQGLPKQGKMDYIIEKCTELGVSKIVPVALHRSVSTVKDEKSEEKKLSRWRKIASESVKQCKRGVIPSVSNVLSLKEAIEVAKGLDLAIAAYEDEREVSLKAVIGGKAFKSIGIFIGPEGGFEPNEIELLKDANIPAVTLGRRILRTETAGHTVLTAVMYETGELG